MIDFPSNPAVDTVVEADNGNKWRWDGSTWNLINAPTPPAVPVDPSTLPPIGYGGYIS